jgi:hypothetical protein
VQTKKLIVTENIRYTLAPSSGYVLTSDAAGNATWAAAATTVNAANGTVKRNDTIMLGGTMAESRTINTAGQVVIFRANSADSIVIGNLGLIDPSVGNGLGIFHNDGVGGNTVFIEDSIGLRWTQTDGNGVPLSQLSIYNSHKDLGDSPNALFEVGDTLRRFRCGFSAFRDARNGGGIFCLHMDSNRDVSNMYAQPYRLYGRVMRADFTDVGKIFGDTTNFYTHWKYSNDSTFFLQTTTSLRWILGTGTSNQLFKLDAGGIAMNLTTGNVDINTTTGAFLPPRMTATQGSAVSASDGMIIYVTDTDATFTSIGFWGYENGAWIKL